MKKRYVIHEARNGKASRPWITPRFRPERPVPLLLTISLLALLVTSLLTLVSSLGAAQVISAVCQITAMALVLCLLSPR